MLNKVILIGRLGRDVELKKGQTPVAIFSLATDEVFRDEKGQKKSHTEWHRIIVFGNQAEICSQYLGKGSLVYVEGKLRTRNYDDKQGNKRYVTEIHADTIRFLNGKKASPDDDLPF